MEEMLIDVETMNVAKKRVAARNYIFMSQTLTYFFNFVVSEKIISNHPASTTVDSTGVSAYIAYK
jgi:hypothetical protein